MFSHYALSKQLQKVCMPIAKCSPSSAYFFTKTQLTSWLCHCFHIICYGSAVMAIMHDSNCGLSKVLL